MFPGLRERSIVVLILIFSGFLFPAGCAPGGGNAAESLPKRWRVIDRAIQQYPADDSGEGISWLFSKVENPYDWKPVEHEWEKIKVKLKKGDKIRNAVNLFFEGVAEKAPSSLDEAYACLKRLSPRLAEKVSASREYEGFFIFSIADGEKSKSKERYWKFAIVKKGRKTYCTYDEERY